MKPLLFYLKLSKNIKSAHKILFKFVYALIIHRRRVAKSRRMRWAGHVARMGEGRGVNRVLVGKPERKRPLGRPRRRWEDNIKIYLQEVGRGCGDLWSWLRIGTGGGHM